ncbi:MAG: hypothetical protein LLG01_08780 [Planctomycetaceae bacterium]|nr:hypothetical protein [Planctomycetaceae bacterium]
MSDRYGFRVAVASIVLAALAAATQGKDAPASPATVLLNKGLEQYRNRDYVAAKATLLQVSPAGLSDSDKNILTERLALVDASIRGQAAAQESLAGAAAAVKSGNVTKARELLTRCADSHFLSPQQRQSAADQLAQLDKSVQAAPTTAPAVSVQDSPLDRAAAQNVARAVKARELLAQAKAVLEAKKPAQARKLLVQALELDPSLAEAKTQLQFTQGLLGETNDAGPVGSLADRVRVARQLNDVEIDAALGRSNERLARAKDAEDFKAALNEAQVAMDRLTGNRDLYSRKEFNDKRTMIENQMRFIQMRQSEWVRKRLAQQEAELLQIEKQRVAQNLAEQKSKVRTLMTRARTLMSERKYPQALEEVRRILAIEPENRWAAERQEDLAQFILLMDEKLAVKDRDYGVNKALIDNQRTEIPWWKEIQYPKDWRELSERRKEYVVTSGEESERDRAAREKLKQRIKELNFDGIELKDVIQFLRDVSGVNIYVRWNALQAAGISKNTAVNVHLQDVTLEKALRVILEDVGASAPLGYILDEGVVTISTRDDLTTRTVTRVYDIRDMMIRPPMFVGPRLGTTTGNQNDNGTTGLGTGTGLGGGLGGGAAGVGGQALGTTGEEEVSQEEILNSITNLIKTTIAPDSWADANRVSIQAIKGQLVITQTAQSQEKIAQLLSQLREAQALQVSIETRFIQVRESFLQEIGVEASITFSNTKVFTDLTNPLVIGPATAPLGGNIAWALNPGSTQIGLDISSLAPPPAFQINNAILDDISVAFLVTATQANAHTHLLTAPRVTLFNGQRSYILVQQQMTYVRQFSLTQASVSAGTTATQQQITVETAVLSTGTMLDVQAVVSDDRRYVTLTVRPQISTGTTRTLTLAGLIDPQGNQLLNAMELPDLLTSELETTVSVPDGGTLLLAGLKQAGQRERELGVPILSKIPIINRLTNNRGMLRDDDVLMVLIKPKIIIQQEEEQLAFP